MVADGSTGRRLVWSLTRFVARQPRAWAAYGYLAVGVLVGATLAGLDADPEQDVTPYPAFVAVLAVLVAARLLYDGVRLHRSSLSAPAGATLSWTTSDLGFRFEHATASHTLAWAHVTDAVAVGRSVLLVIHGTLLPLPRELVGDDLERVRQLVRDAAPTRDPSEADPPSTAFIAAPRLSHVLRFTSTTGREQFREFRRRRARGRLVALTAVALVVAVAVAVLDPSATAAVVAAWLVARAALWLWVGRAARKHYEHMFPEAQWVAAGVVGDDLVIEHPTGRLDLYLRGLRDVRDRPDGVLVRSVSGETATLPHGLLPPDTLERLRFAARRPRAR